MRNWADGAVVLVETIIPAGRGCRCLRVRNEKNDAVTDIHLSPWDNVRARVNDLTGESLNPEAMPEGCRGRSG
jgi:hypothetical protein